MDRKLVGITFAAIAINFFLWNVLMPAFEPADESGHYAHILYIWKQGRLPNLVEPVPTEKGVGYTTYSPLYYWSLIPLAKLVDAPLESEELLPYHPQKDLFKKGVYAVYLHTRDELSFKWNRLIWSVHLLRLQNSVYGLLTVYLVYLTGKKLFGEKSLKPLAATALVGLNPMFAHISNSIVNVNLSILLFSLFFYLTISVFVVVSTERSEWRNLAKRFKSAAEGGLDSSTAGRQDIPALGMTGSGVIAGLAYLTKITGLVLIPIWILSMILVSLKFFPKNIRGRVLFLVNNFGLFLVGFLMAAGWYLVRNLKLYGSLLETGAAIKHFGRPAMQLEMSGPINYWIGFIQTNFKTAFSGYGMVTVNLPDTIIYLLAVVVAIGVWGILLRIGNIWQVILYRFRIKSGMTMELFLTASAILIILGHVAVNFSVEAFHARDLFIGIIPFSLLFVLGVEGWWKKFKTGQFCDYKLINLLMISLIYILTIFHFQQQAVVYVIKSALEGQQIGLEPVLSITAVTVVFVLAWRFFVLKSKNFYIAAARFLDFAPAFAKASAGKRDDGTKITWGLTVGLFAANLAILFILVIPRLYQP